MAQKISRAAIFDVLNSFMLAGANSSLMAMKAVKGIDVDGGVVQIVLQLPHSFREQIASIQGTLKATILALPEVKNAEIVIEWESQPQEAERQNLLPTVKKVIVVGSGKGGVGKSTISANLACTMAVKGLRVGLMDADLYGPSMGMMFGVGSGDGPTMSPDGTIIPVEKYGLKLMSMGFLIDDDKPIIWRGPMLNKALNQFMTEVDWGELDILFIDLPPGTGDIQISLIHNAYVSGAIVVSTPQDVAFLDAKKAIAMFNTVNVPILGVIENMSSFICPNCKKETQIFGHGGVRNATQQMGLPFLGEIPIDLQLRTSCDSGTPIATALPDSPLAHIFADMATKLESTLQL
ncbi:MAG: Mrp/NBP35 family ATP-binding protein [Holophagaceae bacterium]|nr:Mrp/NBP35 family ATP-binding protein [Holophagaceae bacterium]